MNIQVFPSANSTKEIQQAIDQVWESGGGQVILNDGEYHVSSVLLRSNVTLFLKANVLLKGSRDPEEYDLSQVLQCPEGADYTEEAKDSPIAYLGRFSLKPSRSTDPFSRWSRAIIKAYRAQNIAVIGEEGATIDGQNCYDALGEENFRGPHFINFHECDGITLKGYTLKNSSNWGNAIFTSSNILCENITVLAGHDGIDLMSCDNVIVRDCCFKTGDDCVAGFDCCNVLVENCELNTACNALRIGGNNFRVSKCYFHGPGLYGQRGYMTLEEKIAGKVARANNSRTNMEAAFTYYCDFRYRLRKPAEDMVIEDCVIENCDKLIIYNFIEPRQKWQKNVPLTNLTFRRITAKGLKEASHLYAPEDLPLELSFEHVEMTDVQDPVITMVYGCEKKEWNSHDLMNGEEKNNESK